MKKTSDNPESVRSTQGSTVESFVPSLSELIARIDGDIDPAPLPVVSKEPHAGKTPALAGSSENDQQYIQFSLNNIRLALSLSRALEIGYLPAITPLPNLPSWILGVSNIRGEIVSMVDLARFFEIGNQGAVATRRFIITGNEKVKLGLVVDRISGILHMNRLQAQIQSAPYSQSEMALFIKGVVVQENDLLNILDVDKLLSSSKMTDL